MSEKRLKIVLPIVIIAAGALATVALINLRRPVPTRPPEEFAPLVRVVEARPETRRLVVRTHGTVTPRTETTIVAEVAGRVLDASPSFASGGFFEEGEVLMTIDPADYRLNVVTARGEVAQARVRLETEEAQARVAREEWAALGSGEGTPLATRELQVKEARAALASADARLEKAERDLARTHVRAPFTCRVREKLADVGRYVTPGTPTARVFAVDYVEIRLPIPDSDLAHLDIPLGYRNRSSDGEGPEVVLSADFAGRRRTWTGRIDRVEGEVDPVSRMIHVVARVDDPYGRRGGGEVPLSVGVFVEAAIMGRVVEDAIAVPRSAVRAGDVLWVVGDDDRLGFREVEVIRAERDTVIVGAGLRPGERVCVSALQAVTNGMTVRPLGGSGSAAASDSTAGLETESTPRSGS